MLLEWVFRENENSGLLLIKTSIKPAQTKTPNCTGKKFNKKQCLIILILIKLEISLNINT